MSERFGDKVHGFENIADTANYLGNWSSLQSTRASSKDFIDKLYRLYSLDYVDSVLLGFRDEYAQRFESATSAVTYVDADEKLRHTLGQSVLGMRPVVYRNATHNGNQLTSRQKDIVAAHETYHSLVDASGDTSRSLIWAAFDFDKLSDKQQVFHLRYISKPDELLARMAQVKNYFGMANDEHFTAAHLEYAKRHYVTDTAFDNRMSLFFNMIDTRSTKFVNLMNTLPV